MFEFIATRSNRILLLLDSNVKYNVCIVFIHIRSLALCLSEVEQADYVIGILGARYGWVTSRQDIPTGDDYDWMRQLPAGQSATALEIQLALKTKPRENCMFYIRSSDFIK